MFFKMILSSWSKPVAGELAISMDWVIERLLKAAI
jgi:hypothetical protein